MHRYNAFTKSVSNAKPDLSALPPTEGAARQHAFRVYHQIQFLLGNELPPVQWGWKLESDRLIPNCHGECLNGVTSTLEEDFDNPDDPDVINLEETDHSVQRTNTEHLVHEDQNTVLAGRLTRSQAAS
ncbi:hypothetical protein JTB14_015463 [Gonioctena quinquepunctata]|nr:hypothetical protein JTB14_015463 [Gonioctena quinquepunctata]